jgi:hypothetical protein
MNVDNITIGTVYAVTDRKPRNENYTWGGRRNSGGSCWRRPVTVVDIFDGSVLIESSETFFSAPPFRLSTNETGHTLPPEQALERPVHPSGGLDQGQRVWVAAWDIECPWDEIAEDEEPRRTRPQRRIAAIRQLREAGLDRRVSDLGCIDVDVALLVEMVDELEAFRTLARAERQAS